MLLCAMKYRLYFNAIFFNWSVWISYILRDCWILSVILLQSTSESIFIIPIRKRSSQNVSGIRGRFPRCRRNTDKLCKKGSWYSRTYLSKGIWSARWILAFWMQVVGVDGHKHISTYCSLFIWTFLMNNKRHVFLHTRPDPSAC